MKGFFKDIEKVGAQMYSNNQNSSVVSLAGKYGVPFSGGAAQVGCPGIVNPLGETPPIQLTWGSGFENQDKTDRFNQFANALQTLELYNNNHNINVLEQNFKSLNIHGRVMFLNVAAKQVNAQTIIQKVQPITKIGLNMQEIPYTKGGVTIDQILNKYASPLFEAFHITTSTAASSSVSINALSASFSQKLAAPQKQEVKPIINNNNNVPASKQSELTLTKTIQSEARAELEKTLKQEQQNYSDHQKIAQICPLLISFLDNKITMEPLIYATKNFNTAQLSFFNLIVTTKLATDSMDPISKQEARIPIKERIEYAKKLSTEASYLSLKFIEKLTFQLDSISSPTPSTEVDINNNNNIPASKQPELTSTKTIQPETRAELEKKLQEEHNKFTLSIKNMFRGMFYTVIL